MSFSHLRTLCALSVIAPAVAQVTPYGCSVNPPGSLTVVSGAPDINTTFTIGIDNPLGTQGCPAFTVLFVDDAPDPAFPCGTILPGWGMTGPGAGGELLLNPIDGGIALSGGMLGCGMGPATVDIPVPPVVGLVGRPIYFQGLVYDPGSAVALGLTEGLEIVIGPSTTSSFGASILGSINPIGEIEVYRIAARAGDQLVVPYVRTTGSGFAVEVGLYDLTGQLLAGSSGTGDRFLPPPIPADGDYLLAIRGAGGVVGSFHATIERTRAPGRVVQSLAVGDSIAGSIAPAQTEIDIYSFPGRAGDRLEIPFTRVSGSGFSLQFELYDAAGNLLDALSGASDVFRPNALPADGTYYLWVSNPARNVTGTYHFTLQRLVDPGNRRVLALGDDVASSIRPTWTDIDVYELAGGAGDRWFIPYARTSGSGFSLQLELRDSAGTLLGTTSGSSGVFEPGSLPNQGVYFLWVRNPARNVTGNYHLSVQRENVASGAIPLTLPRASFGASISPVWTQLDVYRIAGVGGLFLKAPFARTTGSGFSLELRLYDSSGVLVATAAGVTGELCTQLPSTGDYYLWARNPGLNTTGNYTLAARLDLNGCL